MPAPGTPIRRSSSRQDSSGQRHELPQQASLEVLSSMEPSPRSPSAGSRCKTPVGSAPPSRRSQPGSLRAALSASTSRIPRPPSSSLTAEASCSSERATLSSRASVASGCLGMGDTFITELRKDYPRGMVTPDSSLCAIDSAANPMQSPNNSAYFSLPAADSSYGSLDRAACSSPGSRADSAAATAAHIAAGGHGRYAGSDDDEADDMSEYESAAGGCSSSSRLFELESGYSQAASLLHSEATNPMMTPEGSNASCHQSAAAGAALQVIQNLYCPAADAGSGGKQTGPGRSSRSTLGGRPSTAPAAGRLAPAADRRAPLRSSMVGGRTSTAAENADAGSSSSSSSSSQACDVAAVQAADSSDMEAPAEATASSPEAAGSPGDDSASTAGEEAVGTSQASEPPVALSPSAEAEAEAGSEKQEQEAVVAGSQQEQQLEPQQEEEQDDTQDQSWPSSPCPRTPPTAAAAAAAEPSSGAEGAASEVVSSPSSEDEEAAGQLSSQEVLREAEARMTARPLLQQQLADLLEGVRGKVDGEGQQLVEMPAGYEVLVERMLMEARAQNQSLFGWEGPRRFGDLPISRLPGDASDPQLEAGLSRIHQLDERLREADIKLLVASREAHPEQYAAQEKLRLEQRQQQIEAALEEARKKRLHAAKIARALQQQAVEEGAGGAAAQQQQWQEGQDGLSEGGEASRVSSTVMDSVWRYYILSEAEEQLLEQVMARDEEELIADDPFDVTRTVLEVEDADEAPDSAAAAGEGGSGSGGEGYTAAAGGGLEAEGTQCSTSSDHLQPGLDSTAAVAAGRPSTPGSVHSSMFAAASCSGVTRMSRGPRRLSIADIDAQLEALHKGIPLGSDTCSQTTTLSPQQSSCLPAMPSTKGSRRRTSNASRSDVGSSRLGRLAPSAAGDLPGGAQAGSAAGPSSSRDTGSIKRDYIREQRETKELLKRLKDIDASIRSLKTAELPNRLDPEQLKALLASCMAPPQAQPSQQLKA